MTDENKEIDEKLKEVVIIRLETLPSNLRLSVGNEQSLTKEEMIDHVKKGDEIGKQIINSHLSFMRAIAKGELTKSLVSV